MASFTKAKIGDEEWPITVDSVIFDSGSSINHIPTKEYNILLNTLTRDHKCKTVMNPLETYYCECSGANDPSYPTLRFHSGDYIFNFEPIHYLIYEQIDDVN